MAIAVTIETTITRPPADVFARIADIDAWPSWLTASGIVGVARASGGHLVEGERVTVDQRAAGRAGTFQASITALQPPARFALTGRDGDGVTIDIDAVLAPAGASTLLRWSIRIVGVARASGGHLVEGERVTVDQRAAGRAGTFEASVTALQPPARFALTGRDGDGVTIDIDAVLAPAGASTLLRWSIRIGLPLRYRMFESMARPQVERAAALDIEAFKRSLESTRAD